MQMDEQPTQCIYPIGVGDKVRTRPPARDLELKSKSMSIYRKGRFSDFKGMGKVLSALSFFARFFRKMRQRFLALRKVMGLMDLSRVRLLPYNNIWLGGSVKHNKNLAKTYLDVLRSV